MQAVEYDFNLDEQAKRIGLIVGVSEEIYFCSISRTSQVFMELINDEWVAWRETFIPNTNKRKSYKTLAVGEFDLVLARVKSYLGYLRKQNK
ncbi:pathogenicity island protein [Staphylococcus sp. HMSC063F03]|uniref:pathogenicity island protein n=1 Tax=Staphylococcus TaxID=1279 RepID=UPI0008A900DB|nr:MULTISPECIES: pathogenicity island protein [Staphylococcus]MDO0972087.1 pathogenicity island protein [Staphylococcus haemolyticus]OHP95712.1 pathogenicity island protein [Staphylococcus sp. HMSC063F05]OHP96393.1 pathogenicity island protein [Staphylococcus sp. HMSC063F03]